MTRKVFWVFIALLVLLPFLLSIGGAPVQSYTDFFINGAHKSTEAIYAWSSQSYGSNVGGSVWRFFPFSLIYSLLNNVLLLKSGVTQLIVCGFLFITSFVSYVKLGPLLLDDFRLSPTTIKLGGLFYIFNPYTLTQFTSSFLLVIPYLLLPLQILLFLKAFKTMKYGKYLILLSLVNAFCFGINLIFDVISLLVILLIAYFKLNRQQKVSLKSLIAFSFLTYSLSLILCSFWIVPQLYSSLIDPSSTQYVLTSELFYNSDSSITKVLRGLGEWSFFSGQNNIPYNNFANEYKNNILVITTGYLFPILSIISVFFYKQRDKLRSGIIALLASLFLIFLIVVGTYPSTPFASVIQQAFDHIPFAMAFRNTYKFASIEMLIISLLLTITLSNLYIRDTSKRKAISFFGGLLVIGLICINAFPFFTNQIYSKNNQINKIPSYWEQTAKSINNQPNADSQYVFMLPNQYFEALRWNGQQKTFSRNLEETLFKPSVVHNACRGCGQYLTSNFLSYVYNNLSAPGTFKLLGMTGNSTIVQRNDYDSKYYNVQTPTQIKSILSKNKDVMQTQSIGQLDQYQIDKQRVNPIIYSPSKLVATNTINTFSTIAQQNQKSTALILTNTINKSDSYTLPRSNYYQPVFSAGSTTTSKGKASSAIATPRADTYRLTNSQSQPKYRLGYTSTNGHYVLKLGKITNSLFVNGRQITSDPANDLTIDLGSYGASSIVAEIQQRSFLLKPNVTAPDLADFSVDPSDINVKVYSTQSLGPNLVTNGSLENGTWQQKVGDCAQASLNPQVGMSLVKNDATDGVNSLLLSAKEDSACAYTPPLNNFQPGTYFFSFDAKRVKGGSPSYCAWSGKECVSYSSINAGSNWTNYSQAVYMKPTATNFYLYLYAQKANFTETKSQYDNVKIYRLSNPLKTIGYTVPANDTSPQTVELGAGTQKFQTNLSLRADNLIENGNFEDGPWQSKVQNCSDQTGTTNISMRAVKDSTEGTALKLSTTGLASACTNSAAASNYSQGSSYLAQVKYKVVQGQTAKICIWNGRSCIANKSFTPYDHNWHTAEILAAPSTGDQPISVYLYAPNGEPTQVLYTGVNVQQVENSFINAYTLANINEQLIAPATVSYKKDNPTRYEAYVATNNVSLLSFSQSYHPGWKAYMVKSAPHGFLQDLVWDVGLWKRYKLPDSQHTATNGFTNGWWIDAQHIPSGYKDASGTYHMVLDYSPQSFVRIGLIVSGIALVSCLLYLYRSYIPKKEHFKGWRYVGPR